MPILGLDVGNAFGYVCVARQENDGLRTMPLLSKNYRNSGMPTDVKVKPGGKPLVASAVAEGGAKYKAKECDVVRLVKDRLLPDGAQELRESIPCELPDGSEFFVDPRELYGAIVKELVTVANKELSDAEKAPEYRVVVAVPSVFAENNTDAVRQIREIIRKVTVSDSSGQQHTLEAVDTIPEPVAAAVSYLHARNSGQYGEAVEGRLCAVVYDYGHGTFDTALVEIDSTDGSYHVWHRDGERIGGSRMDQFILEHFQNQLNKNGKTTFTRRENDQLFRFAHEAKESLSESDDWEGTLGDLNTLFISRGLFNDLIGSDVDRTIRLTEKVLQFAWDNGHRVDALVMTGGCSNIPYVRERVQELAKRFSVDGSMRCNVYKPSTAIAEGAALYAAEQERLTNYAGFTYSIRMPDEGIQHIISADARLPYTSEAVTITNNGERYYIARSLGEGESGMDGLKYPENFRFDEPIGEKICVTVSVDKDSRLTLTITRPDGSADIKIK